MTKKRVINIQYQPYEDEISGQPMRAGKFMWNKFGHSYPVFAQQLSGNRYKYQTGLDPKDYPEDQREEVEQAFKDLSREFGGDDVLDPFNHEFWKDIRLVLEKKNTFLNIDDNPKDKLLYYAIKGGGIKEVSPSFDAMQADPTQRRFYMVEPEEFAEISSVSDKQFNKAIAALEDLEDNRTYDEMFLIHKVLVTSDRGTTKNTPKAALYKDLSDFISGKLVKTDKRKTPGQFVETYKLLKENIKRLYVTAYVKEASYFNFLTTTPDNQLQNQETKTKYGGSIDKAVEYLLSITNQYELENIKDRVENKWKE